MRSCTIRLGYVGTSTAGPATQAPDFELAQTGVVACPEALDVETRSALGALPESADLRRGTRAWHASPKRDMRSSSPQPGQNKNELLDGVSDRRRVFGHYHLTFERTSALGIELVGPGSVGIPRTATTERPTRCCTTTPPAPRAYARRLPAPLGARRSPPGSSRPRPKPTGRSANLLSKSDGHVEADDERPATRGNRTSGRRLRSRSGAAVARAMRIDAGARAAGFVRERKSRMP
jgi:hypothetical protein